MRRGRHGGSQSERTPLLGLGEVHLQIEGAAASRYAIKEVIGYGATSSVHLCEKLGTGSAAASPTTGSINGGGGGGGSSSGGAGQNLVFACKVVDKRKLGIDSRVRAVMLDQLRNEVRVLKRLSHPNVISLEDVFEVRAFTTTRD